MTFKPGDKVMIIDGYGNTIAEEVTVVRCGRGSIVIVREMVNGQEIKYGVPIGSVEPVKPSVGDVVHALGACFVKEEETK